MTYFSALNYSLGDEDPSVEVSVLPPDSKHVMCIAGSGTRVVPLLARKPRILTCVDILPEQLALTELRIEAIRCLRHEEFMQLMGYDMANSSPRVREALFERVQLSAAARTLLQAMFSRNGWAPIIYIGKFEQMLMTLSKLFRLVAGQKILRMFDCWSVGEQRQYFASPVFPAWRWNAALFLFGNATVLNALLYGGDFPRKNVPGSAYSVYKKIFANLFSNVVCRQSFFLQMLLLGELRFPSGALPEADAEFFEQAKQSLAGTRIAYVQGDIGQAMMDAAEPVDFLSLSDVPSFFDHERERTFLQQVRGYLKDAGRVVFRGHMRMAQPDTRGYADITGDYLDAVRAEKTQLWNVRVLEKR